MMDEMCNKTMIESFNDDDEKIVRGNLAKPISVATVPPTAYGVGDIDDDYE